MSIFSIKNFNLLDWIFPVSTQNTLDNDLVFSFSKPSLNNDLEAIWVGFDFENQYADELIHRIKNGGEFTLIPDLVDGFYEQLVQFLQLLLKRQSDNADENNPRLFKMFQAIFDPNSKVIFGYVPADPFREVERGFHLPELLANQIVDKLNTESQNKNRYQTANIFLKPKSTVRQTGLNREQRLNIVLPQTQH